MSDDVTAVKKSFNLSSHNPPSSEEVSKVLSGPNISAEKVLIEPVIAYIVLNISVVLVAEATLLTYPPSC